MGRRILLLGAMAAAVLGSGCNRPEGGWRDRTQDQSEPTQSGPVSLPEVQSGTSDGSADLLDQLEGLLNDLDASLDSESEWQLDVPEEIEAEFEDELDLAAIDDLLSQLASSLGTLDGALASESAQQIDPP